MEFWKVADLALGIVITCRGHDKQGTAAQAVNAFDELAAQRADRFTIYADLREMTGYESESRQAWQEAFRRYAERVDALVLIGAQSAMIRMGAAAVGSFAAIPVRFVESWSELPAAPSVRPSVSPSR